MKKLLRLEKLKTISITKFTIILLLIKTLTFLSILSVFNLFLNINIFMLLFYLTFIVIIVAPGYCLKERAQTVYCIIVNILYSLLLTADIWYYRANWNFLGLRLLFFKDFFNPFKRNIINPQLIDIIFWVDILLLIYLIKKGKVNIKYIRSKLRCALSIVTSILIILVYHLLIDVKDITKGDLKLFQTDWAPHIVMSNLGPIGYHIYEIGQTIDKLHVDKNPQDTKDIEEWLSKNNEGLPDNEYKGVLKGKNIIFLQIESFENFVIGQKVNGQEITPNLNKLIKSSYYFDNIYEQNGGGNSIDCDMMVNTSTFPLLDQITFLTHAEAKYNSLPKVLKEVGYHTISTHAERGSDWNWGEAHSNALGFDEQWDISQYKIDEIVGFGLSDRSFLSQFANKLSAVKQPFYSILPTLSSHGPFKIDQKYRELSLPKELDENYLGGYFQSLHYTDKQLGVFIDKLRAEGLMQNSVVVIYGDHSGVHKYYNDKIQSMQLEGNWWQTYEKKIPLIIYSEGITPKTFDVYGGQTDIMPTILYLLGVNNDLYRNTVMGRVLVNTQRDAVVIKGNEIKGHPKNEAEIDHLKQSYDIGRKIILSRYFNK